MMHEDYFSSYGKYVYIYISIKVLLDTIGLDYVMPSRCNSMTLEKGVVHSPETACLPFKTILGYFIYGIEHGADVILFGGGCGQCRLGYYGDLKIPSTGEGI